MRVVWQSVEDAWPAVAREHEGSIPWPYLDSVSKVTVGVGMLIEADNKPTAECFGLPWTVDGLPATRAQIAAGWNAVNNLPEFAGKAARFATVSRLRLDDATINGVLLVRTRQFWSELVSQVVNLEFWPADAQLALIDMAYQLGPWFMEITNIHGAWKWPNFRAAAHSSDFIKCADNCTVKQASTERNGHRIRLFQNAAQVVFLNLDPARLWDTDPPKEDDDVVTDAQIQEIAEKVTDMAVPEVVAAVIAELKRQTLVSTPSDVARAVLNSPAADLVKVSDRRGTIRPATALSEIHKAVTKPGS